MRLPSTIGYFHFSDGQLAYCQRIAADLLASLPPPSRKRVPRRRHNVICDGPKLRQLMAERGLDAAGLAAAAGVWGGGREGPVGVALESGELSPMQAGRIARALGCVVVDFQLGIRAFDLSKPRRRS